MRAIRQHARTIGAKVKSAWRGTPLPPGDFFRLSPYFAKDRRGLVDKAADLGPLMTARWEGRLAICVIGFPTARRLLAEHAPQLKPLSIVLDSIVPNGFLRMMEGDVHKRYRPIFSRAFDSRAVDQAESDIDAIMRASVQRYLSADDSAERLIVMEKMTTRLLIRTCLGISPECAVFGAIQDEFLRLGPGHFVWKVGDAQRRAFECIRRYLEDSLSLVQGDPRAIANDSVLGRLRQSGALDPTTVGNLIYMVEMGRQDLKRYFTWIVHFLEQNPPCLDRLETAAAATATCPFSRSVALETLRLEQSERLMRKAREDFVFDGFLFPKGAIVWISLWEAHKDHRAFPDPYTFNPDRFPSGAYGLSQYAPFGLDHHRCPASELVIRLAARFSELLGRSRIPQSNES